MVASRSAKPATAATATTTATAAATTATLGGQVGWAIRYNVGIK